jgi:cytochrome c-type biogenesis protein CcmF
MPVFGSFSLLLALALSAYTLLAGAFALRQLAIRARTRISPERLAETARRAGIASFFATTAAAFALVWAAFTNDFSVSYILHHSNRALPGPYKFAALWSGQEGSLLLWAWLLATYGFVLRLRHKVDVRLTAYASTILAGVQVFFLLLLNFAAPPFALVEGAPPADGFGLNPLLQYPEMVIHPPMLYLGYVGFTVPFAFALGALMMRYPGEKWIHITRRWTMVTWLFLTCGVFLGAHWAYSVLGWGGYWAWDPVENASLMPWLTGTAFLHSVMMQEKRGMMKNWNVWLIFSTFLLSILGTLLTRSGLVSSVHAFAQSSIGSWFYAFLFIVLVVCVFTFILQRDHLKSDHKIESLVSRESSFLFNNLIFLAACFTILWGTLFPVLSEYVQGNRVTVGAPWYNRIAVPIGLGLLALMGLGPLLAWRSSSLRSIRRNFVLPAIATIATAVRIPARRARAEGPDRQEYLCRDAASHPAQYPPLRRLHRPLRRSGYLHRPRRLGVQSLHRAGDGLPPVHAGWPLHAGLPGLHAGHESQLRQRVCGPRCLPQRQEGNPARPGEALLRRLSTGIHHGGKSLDPRLGPVRDLRWSES